MELLNRYSVNPKLIKHCVNCTGIKIKNLIFLKKMFETRNITTLKCKRQSGRLLTEVSASAQLLERRTLVCRRSHLFPETLSSGQAPSSGIAESSGINISKVPGIMSNCLPRGLST